METAKELLPLNPYTFNLLILTQKATRCRIDLSIVLFPSLTLEGKLETTFYALPFAPAFVSLLLFLGLGV